MDSLHDDLFGLRDDGDSSLCNRAAINSKYPDAPEKYRHILCSKCKSLTKPKIQDLCRACVKKIAAVLAGGHGHGCSTSSEPESEASSDLEPDPEADAGRLVIGDRIAVPSLGSQSLDADIGIPSPTRISSPTWHTTTTWTTTSATTVTTESSRTHTQTRSHSATRARAVCEHEHELRMRKQRASEAEAKAKAARERAERERAEAAARAKFQAWLHERTQHRNWQKQMVNYLRIKYPRSTRLSKFLANIKTCPCHDDPDCSVQISLEYKEHLALEEADRTYRLTDGRGIADWVPYFGYRAKKFWVDREVEYLSSLACSSSQTRSKAGVESNLNDGGGIEVGGLLGGQFAYSLGGRELILGLWMMRVVLDCVWGRVPDARWRVERASDRSGQGNRGTFEDDRTALLLYQERTRGKRAAMKMDPIKGCLLWTGERNPCWALLPLLRGGGDVGIVWRWERFVWEANGWNPFMWIWRKLFAVFSYPLRVVKWLVGYLGFGFGFGDVEDENHDDGDLD